MKKKQPKSSKAQSVMPYLLYNDVGKALTWLGKAFGFVEFGDRFEADGTIQHAAIVTHDGGDVIMMAPPLMISEDLLDKSIKIIGDTIDAVHQQVK